MLRTTAATHAPDDPAFAAARTSRNQGRAIRRKKRKVLDRQQNAEAQEEDQHDDADDYTGAL